MAKPFLGLFTENGLRQKDRERQAQIIGVITHLAQILYNLNLVCPRWPPGQEQIHKKQEISQKVKQFKKLVRWNCHEKIETPERQLFGLQVLLNSVG